MIVKDVVLRNWASLPDGCYQPGLLTLITGGNGAGKTTVVDAIQTVLTAALAGYHRYNAGQDESEHQSRTKTRRTVSNYALGLDDGAYARPVLTDSYIAINFTPSQGEENQPFSALVAIRASYSQEGTKAVDRLVSQVMYILPSHTLSLANLQSDDGQHWLDMEGDLEPSLRLHFGQANVEVYDSKTKYLQRLWARFLGGDRKYLSATDMRHMVKAFVKFLAYKPVSNINQFVRESVLEARDKEDTIGEVRSLMQRVATMSQEARRIGDAVTVLDRGERAAASFLSQFLDNVRSQSILKWRNFYLARTEYLQLIDRKKALTEEIASCEVTSKQLNGEYARIHKELVRIEAMLTQLDGYGEKQTLDLEVRGTEQTIAESQGKILASTAMTHTMHSALLELLNLLDNRPDSPFLLYLQTIADDLRKAHLSLNALSELDLAKLRNEVNAPWLRQQESLCSQVSRSVAALMSGINTPQSDGQALIDRMKSLQHDRQKDVEVKTTRIRELEVRIRDLDTESRVAYPKDTNTALAEIRRKYPDANPRVVGDHIDIGDDDWQEAIEGYMGNARFNIVVDPEFEADSIQLLRGLRSQARVVQGQHAVENQDNHPVLKDSIVNLMTFDDEIVRAYIQVSYGNVKQVVDAEVLRRTPRGVTMDCMASGGYSMRICRMPDDKLMCGQGAKRRVRVALQQQLNSETEDLSRFAIYNNELRTVVDLLGKFREFDLHQLFDVMATAVERRDDALNALKILDLSEMETLEEEKARVEDQLESVRGKQGEISGRIGELRGELFGANGSMSSPDRRSVLGSIPLAANKQETCEDEAVEQVNRLWRLAPSDYASDIETLESLIKDQAEILSSDQLSELESQTADEKQLQKDKDSVMSVLRVYNEHPIHGEPIQNALSALPTHNLRDDDFYLAMRDARKAISIRHHALRNSILVKHQRLLEQAKVEFEETFSKQLVLEVVDHIQQSKKVLRDINRELEGHRFDDETYRFEWSRSREFEPYLKCFEEIAQLGGTSTQGLALFGDKALSEASRDVLDSLQDLLLQEDTVHGNRELSRIADYRNYHEYDIIKYPEGKDPIALSTYGTGSGGQSETPFYVIMAAAFQSSMRFGVGPSHFRTICIDESFSKLDENRTRRILDYLAKKAGLQVIFVCPSNRSGIYKDLITNQWVIDKVTDHDPPLHSQLKTRVLLNDQVMNQDRIGELFEAHRDEVSRQTQLAFMAYVNDRDKAEAEAGGAVTGVTAHEA